LTNLGVAPPADPSILVLKTDSDREVVAAVKKLKPKDREIIMLYAWEDLPRPVIAQMMGMTKSAVDQRIHRAYEKLARSLSQHLEPTAFNSPPVAEKGGS
jgi:RNA polymerase sigma-70 factor (ECF subfamily)